MSCLKRPLDGQDPDYEDTIPHEAKRLRLLEENAKAEFSQRISAIIQKEFSSELTSREKDVHEIQERLHQAQKLLHMLRYVIVSAFYNKKQAQSGTEEKQKRVHPAVKKLIGKEPRNWEPLHQRPSKYRPVPVSNEKEPSVSKETSTPNESEKKETVCKVPRYIPPKSCPNANISPSSPRRGMHHKVKKRIVIGNISKWVPVDTREDAASHKWMMYVRGPKEAPDVSDFISKVRFFLHPSYRPHDIAEVTSPPFHLSRRGWGEFPVRVQIHFCHARNKPVDIIHHLKLDRTYTGLQTLGAETVVDIWLHSGNDSDVLSSDKEAASTEESTSVGNSDALEQLVPEVKVEGSVNSSASQEVCDSPTKEHSLGLIEPKMEIVDSFDCSATCDNTSKLDANVQGEHSSCDLTSSLDHDYFGGMNVDIKTVCVDSCKSVQSLPGCSQENTSEGCTDVCNMKSSVDLDSDVQNHVIEDAPAVQENKNNSIPLTPDLLTESAIGSSSFVEQNVSIAKNESKLTTLVKCMDRNGHVFYLTLGKTDLKPQMKLASVVPKLDQSVKVANLTSLLTKQQSPNTVLRNKLSPTAVVVPKSKLKASTVKAQLSNYDCKVKGDVTSQDNSGCIPLQSNSSLFVPPHGISGSVMTSCGDAHSLSSEDANSSTLVTLQRTSTVMPIQSTNSKPCMKVTPSMTLANNLSEVLKQLQSSSGKSLSFLKQNVNVPTTERLEEGNEAGDLKVMNLGSAQKSTPVQDQSLLIVKNGHLYLVKHIQNSTALSALAAKSSAKKCEAIPKQHGVLSETVRSSKSLLTSSVHSTKGGFSLLKKQAKTLVPKKLLPPNVMKTTDVDSSEDTRLVFSGRTLVLNKANSRHITHSSKIHYTDALNVAVDSCKFDDIAHAVRWLLRHMPLISPSAKDPAFRVLHPYAAPSEGTFLQWNVGKQRAAEWFRAKAVQRVLQERFPEKRVWCTHAIVVWAKLHGYTPVPHPADAVTEHVSSGPTTQRTYSEPVGIMDWLVTNHKSDQCSGVESDTEVDVVGVELPQTKATIKQGPSQFDEVDSTVEVLELDPDLQAHFLFVRETAREVGFKFSPQELVPGVLFCAAERVLLEAVQSLADDLLRRALFMAWKRNSNRHPDCITVDDVRTAILTRPELDLFSNKGLGVQVTDTG